jgi:hypothetical protein
MAINLLIGEELGEGIFILNAQLRAETLAQASAKFSLGSASYSPWMCAYPMSDRKPPEVLLNTPVATPGDLVCDQSYLAAAREFIRTDLRMIENGLNQNYDDWLPELEVSTENQARFSAGKDMMLSSTRILAKLYRELVDFVLPLGGDRNRGYSMMMARGAIVRTLPASEDEYDVAIDLAHELGHQCFYLWQSADPIMTTDQFLPVFSEIRKAFRPAFQSFHAAVALAFMLTFVQSRPDDKRCQEAAKRRGKKYRGTLDESLGLAIYSLRTYCQFTPIGERIIQEMEALI